MRRRQVDQPTDICGDVPLSWKERRRYLRYGLQQIAESLKDGVRAQSYRCSLDQEVVRAKVLQGASPLRVYTCALADELGSELMRLPGPIGDIGCGSGEHSRFFTGVNGDRFYIGIDAVFRPQWSQQRTESSLPRRFVQTSVTNLGFASNSLACTFSSSTLEHVSDTPKAIQELARAMRPGAYGLHIVPGVWSLFLYMFHGYRRFSCRVLTEAFTQEGLEVVRTWSLGGLASFLLHGVWITWLEQGAVYGWLLTPPEQQRRWWHLYVGTRMRRGPLLRAYSQLLRLALRLDRWVPHCPMGYGFLVQKR